MIFKWKIDQQNKTGQIEHAYYYFEPGSIIQKIAGENLATIGVVMEGLKLNITYYW